MATETRLETRDLIKRFGGNVAVNGVGFDINGGEILGLLGPNGSGKSTVMKLIMGIEKPNSGQVSFAGRDITGLSTHRIAKAGIGIVFQHSRPLHRQTVLENIKLAMLPDSLMRSAADADVDRRAGQVAERVGLYDVLDNRPATLPFADLRRIEMAKVIARDPRVVLVDEPFAGLASNEMKAFSDLIRGFRDEGRAVLLVDHNVKSVVELADRAYAMYLGEPIAEGAAEEVIQSKKVREVYLGGESESYFRKGKQSDEETATLLAVRDVDVFYGKAQALERASLRPGEEQFISVLGLNGAGKTTLFNAISGVVLYKGAINYNGSDLT